MQGKKREIGFWSLVAGLLPLAYASSYAALGMAPAEGCSGASYEETGVIYLSAEAEAPVATDGFFPFRATSVNVESDEALAQIVVEVRDADGEVVPGATTLLSKESGKDGLEYLLLGWSVSGTARDEGEELSFHAEAQNSVESVTLERALTVGGAVPELVLPSFEVTDWLRVKYDAGPQVTCSTWADCDSYAAFGSELHDAWQMTLAAPKVTPPVLVVWEFEWQALPGKGRFLENPSRFDEQTAMHDSLVFVAGEEEYCARLRGRDVHTGETKEQDFCGSPSGGESVVWDSIAECAEPPEGYLERWCLVNGEGVSGDPAEECEPYLHPPTGVGGTGDVGGAGGSEPEPSASGKGGTAGKGGTGSGGTASSGVGTAGKRPVGEPGSGGSTAGKGGAGPPTMPDAEDDANAASGQKRVLTEAGCACRTAPSDERDSALGGLGFAVVALALGTRRRRFERRSL